MQKLVVDKARRTRRRGTWHAGIHDGSWELLYQTDTFCSTRCLRVHETASRLQAAAVRHVLGNILDFDVSHLYRGGGWNSADAPRTPRAAGEAWHHSPKLAGSAAAAGYDPLRGI